MALTPETLLRHELVGLHARVVESTNPDAVGISGRVVSETMRTLTLSDGDRVWQLPKQGTTVEFALPCTDEAADAAKASGTAPKLPSETASRTGQSDGCEDVAYVTVDGTRLLSRPALRTEKAGVSTWR
ncbi:ribonuclease P protein component 1 [Haloplanus aerogenes]|uniref:Ribonuclease P protein component 1 n=1 Tax=Haloplanus aerogenes TaxID=660522 RepID=A0A3M0DA55_9EURY|nr:ribonuclease P protein component 1 [Haloplanus aerogenes]AZH26268.1 ribonuclease P protein component 1 [Haloplanus aerogenes]RMB18274.1 ribonuclease P protein subunit POP4 [Haloplanus aerogenes]